MGFRSGVEYIAVYIDWHEGKTMCICRRDNKRCDKNCSPDVVERDIYRGWKQTFYQDKFGKSKL